MEKISLESIIWLLDITKEECNHELLLLVKNLRELSASPLCYIVFVIPRLLQEELARGEHFVLVDLLKSILGSSSQVGSSEEPQVEVAKEALISFVRPNQSPLVAQDLELAP